MEKVIIQEQTKNCPGMDYDPSIGILRVEGRSIPENPESIFKPLKNWIIDYFKSSDNLKIIIILEYINSGSSKHLLEILKLLKSYSNEGKKINLKWLYEEDDEAILELGEHFRDTSGLPIEIEMLLD